MTTPTLLSMSAPGAIEAAARALREGDVVVLPTETVYGVFVRADQSQRVPQPTPPPWAGSDATAAPSGADARARTWHAPDVQLVVQTLDVAAPVHRHVLERLAPGPVRFVIDKPQDQAQALLSRRGLAPSLVGAGSGAMLRAFSVRVPDHPGTARVLAQVGVPVIAEGVGVLGLDPGLGRSPAQAICSGAAGSMVKFVLDDGPTALGRPSSVVRLTHEGWYRIEGEGAWTQADIRTRVETFVLFVCTGNTCRSPMAEAIARHWLAKPGSVRRPVRVASAGVSAYDGDAMTPEAAQALSGMGVDPGRHRAQSLTKELVEQATVIFAMTAAHARRVAEISPAAGEKVQVLDPSGRDVSDPIGGSLGEYHECAARIGELIRQRFTQRDLVAFPRRKGVLEP